MIINNVLARFNILGLFASIVKKQDHSPETHQARIEMSRPETGPHAHKVLLPSTGRLVIFTCAPAAVASSFPYKTSGDYQNDSLSEVSISHGIWSKL
jgi:hypothetical protein